MGAFCGSNVGTMLIARFRNKVLAGDVPSKEDLDLLAYAFEPLERYYLSDKQEANDIRIDALLEFARRLNLKNRQGQAKTANTLSTISRYQQSVIEYLIEFNSLIKNGAPEKIAKKQARKKIADQEGIGDRAMKDRISKYSNGARQSMDIPSQD